MPQWEKTIAYNSSVLSAESSARIDDSVYLFDILVESEVKQSIRLRAILNLSTSQIVVRNDILWRVSQTVPFVLAFSACSYERNIYFDVSVIKGLVADNEEYWCRYNVDTGVMNNWATGGRYYYKGSIIAVAGILYHFGGSRAWRQENGRPSINTIARGFAGWDIYTGQYMGQLGEMPDACDNMAIAEKEGNIYILGGRSLNAGNFVYRSSVWRYRPGQTTLDVMAAMPGLRARSAAVVVENTIYLTAGASGDIPLKTTLAYSIEHNTWSTVESLPADIQDINRQSLQEKNNHLVLWPYAGYGLTYNLATATVVNPSPSGGFVNEQAANIFNWQVETSPPDAAVVSATFQWCTVGSSVIHQIISGDGKSVNVPAGTFPNGAFEWRVANATTSAGAVAPATAWYRLTTQETAHNAPTSLIPNGGKINATQAIQFSWLANVLQGVPPAAFEIQISYDAGQTWQALSGKIASADSSYIVPAHTLRTGTVYWRVRTYNTDNVASAWSAAVAFSALAAPEPPQWVSVETGKSRPLCRWLSDAQIGWQIQVLRGEEVIYDSAQRPGADYRHKIENYLPRGQYTFRCRVINELSMWSGWADRQVYINWNNRLHITLSGADVPYGAQLDFEAEAR